MSRYSLLVATALALCFISCGADVAPVHSDGGAGGSAPQHLCPDMPGTWPMVLVPRADGAMFCMDSRETTNDQYAAFLAAGPPSSVDPHCTTELDFTPKANWPPAAERGNYPVAAVTWCDAFAYCAAVGKRLCGDSNGSIITIEENELSTLDEWLRTHPSEMWSACTRNGERQFVYGDDGESGRCNDTPIELVAADAPTACEGGYDGIYNLQGNALEWEAACKWESTNEGLASALCVARALGGCSGQSVHGNNDEGPTDWTRNTGIRCCADALLTEPL